MKKLFFLSLSLLALHLGAGAQDTSIVFGSKFYISGKVAQGGTGIVYQWQCNGKDIAGATDTAYTTDDALPPGMYTYVRKSVCAECNGRWQFSNPHTIRVICPAPVQPSTISGSGAVATQCAGTSYVYTVDNIAGYSFKWSLPTSWAQTAGDSSYSITVTTGTVAGPISVTPVQNGSGCVGTASAARNVTTVNVRATLVRSSGGTANQSVFQNDAITNIIYTRTGTGTAITSTLPDGVTYNATTNILSGAPSATGSLAYSITATVTGCPNATALTGTITSTACGGQVYGGKCYRARGDVLYNEGTAANCRTWFSDNNYTIASYEDAQYLTCPLNNVYAIFSNTTKNYSGNSAQIPYHSVTGCNHAAGVPSQNGRQLGVGIGTPTETMPLQNITSNDGASGHAAGLGHLCYRNP